MVGREGNFWTGLMAVPKKSIMTSRRWAFIVLAAAAVVACRPSNDALPYAGPVVLDHLVKGDELPRNFFKRDDEMVGARPPIQKSEARDRSRWLAWARQAWPKACASMEARLVYGKVLPPRACTAEFSAGFIAGFAVEKRGLLEVDGVRIPVIWRYSSFAQTAKEACTADPAGTDPKNYLLTRTAHRNWRMSAFHEIYLATMTHDEVWDSCQHLDRMLDADRALEAASGHNSY